MTNKDYEEFYLVTIDFGDDEIVDYTFEGEQGLENAIMLHNYAVQNGFRTYSSKAKADYGTNPIFIKDWEKYSLRS